MSKDGPRAADCPCSSGRRYRACCAPYHRGQAEAPTPEALMRSRYSAFALKEVGYLWRTLHPLHPERARPEAEVLAGLRATCRALKYPGLEVLETSGPDAEGLAHVTFHARVFESGQDRSFRERSAFRHDGTGWRYLSGVPLPAAGRPPAGR